MSYPAMPGEVQARTQILGELLRGCTIWILAELFIVIPFFAVRKLVPLVLCLLGLVLIGISYRLLKRGWTQPATGVFLFSLWSGTLICSVLSGGISSVFMLIHCAIPVVAGTLLGRRAAIMSVSASVVVMFAFALADLAGHPLPRYFPMPGLTAWMVALLALLFGTLPVLRTQEVLTAALHRAESQAHQSAQDALHDYLTGLPNRTLLLDRLAECIDRERRDRNARFALLFLDLDRFKSINDNEGHPGGDQLLVQVAGRLSSLVHTRDTLARLSGDEFALLLESPVTPAVAMFVAERLQHAMLLPFSVNGHEVLLTVSIGVALSENGSRQAEDMIRDADMAMYRAKALGRAQFAVFDEQMRRSTIDQIALERDLTLACELGQFELHYEPIVQLRSGEILGYEALVRWRRPGHGLLPPRDFLPCAEENGLILRIDRWVIDEACRILGFWRAGGFRIPVSVNVSGKSLMNPGFVEYVMSCLERYRVDPVTLRIEITEQVLVNGCESTFHKLTALGLELALDDFGTGFSSLSYLAQFPISHLKLDYSFIKRLEAGDRDRAVVRSVISLAGSLKMQVTAEGIENLSQMAILKDLGCHNGQGRYWGISTATPDWRRQFLEVPVN